MRIAMLTGEYPPHQGGIGDYTQALSRAILAHEHEVRVYTSVGSPLNKRDIQNDVPVTNLDVSWRLADNPRILRSLRQFKPDIVNIQYEPAAYAMRLGIYNLPPRLQSLDAQTIITWHDILPPYLFPKAGKLRNIIVNRLAIQADGNIFTNTFDSEALTQRCIGQGHPELLTTIIPIGSNITVHSPECFDRTIWRQEHGYPPTATIIGFFGFRNRAKGLEHLIDSLAELRQHGHDAYLLLIGGETGTSDPSNIAYAQEITARIASLKLQSYVKKTGYIPEQDVSTALMGIDMCALPYLEGANLRHGTLHAALAHGCTIITTTEPDGTSALNEKQARLIEPSNTGALTRAIQELSADPISRKALGTEALHVAAEFLWPAIAERTVAFYQTALNA